MNYEKNNEELLNDLLESLVVRCDCWQNVNVKAKDDKVIIRDKRYHITQPVVMAITEICDAYEVVFGNVAVLITYGQVEMEVMAWRTDTDE